MQVVIDIPKDLYKSIICHRCKIDFQQKCDYENLKNAIEDGTPLPKGHGRLIDADAYKQNICTYQETGCGSCKYSSCCPEDAPTIIEADKTESEGKQ